MKKRTADAGARITFKFRQQAEILVQSRSQTWPVFFLAHQYCNLMTANIAVAQMTLIDEFFVTTQILNSLAAKFAPNS